MTVAIADVSIAANLLDTVAVLAPSDWGNPGFSGESRAEWTGTHISDLPANPGNVLTSGQEKTAGPVHSLLSDVPGQAYSGLMPEGEA